MAIRPIAEDDGILDVVLKSGSVLALVFGVWAYFHTVHPIFTKTAELERKEEEVQALLARSEELSSTIEEREMRLGELQQELEQREKRLQALAEYAEERGRRVSELEQQSRELKIEVSSTRQELADMRQEAATAIIYRQMDKLVNEAIQYGTRFRLLDEEEDFDVQRRAFEIAEEGLSRCDSGNVQCAAYEVLKLFAETELKPGITDYEPLLDLLVFVARNESAVTIMRGDES